MFVLSAPIPPEHEAHVLARLAHWRRRIAAMDEIAQLAELLKAAGEEAAPVEEVDVPLLYMMDVEPTGRDPEDAFYQAVMNDAEGIQERFDASGADLVICCGKWVGNAFPDLIEPFLRSHSRYHSDKRGLTYVTAKGKVCAFFSMPLKRNA